MSTSSVGELITGEGVSSCMLFLVCVSQVILLTCSMDLWSERKTQQGVLHELQYFPCHIEIGVGRGQFKYDVRRGETRFRLSAKRTSPFKSAGASVQSTAGSRGVRISGSNAGYTMFRGSVSVNCDGTRAETSFRVSAKRASPFKSAGGRQFSRLLAAAVFASVVVMLDTQISDVV